MALAAIMIVAAPLYGQEPAPAELPRVFLDCQPRWACDSDFLRTEIDWVSWVRDRQVADVHALVTTEQTGSGGQEVEITLIGRGSFEALTDTIAATTAPTATEFERRNTLLGALTRGLLPYAMRTSVADRLRVELVQSEDDDPSAATITPADDPWNFWVFEVGVDGSIDGESREQSQDVSGSIQAWRTTAEWKLAFEVDASYNEDHFELNDGTEFNAIRRGASFDALVVKSLGPHLSAGVLAGAGSSTRDNQDLYLDIAPAVEYNVYPYAESTRRQLTLRYSIGPRYFDYEEETLYGKLEERVLEHELEASLDFQQPWGSARLGFSTSHYIGWEPGATAPPELLADDSPRYAIRFGGGVNVRLFRGLDLRLDGSYARINNQIELERGDATNEEILLELRELSTSYRYEVEVGLSYTFGSIYNTVVNPRFDIGGDDFR